MLAPDQNQSLPQLDGFAPPAELALPLAGAQLGLDRRSYATWRAMGLDLDARTGELTPDDTGYAGGLTLPDSRRESEQQLSLELESSRLSALAVKRSALARKAREAKSETTFKWAADRAASCARPLGPRVAACGTAGLAVRCGCGPRVYWRGCRQWWVCKRCRATRLRPLAPRLIESFTARVVEAQRGGQRVALRMLRLSLRTSGDVDRDRRELGESWRRFYKGLHKWIGQHAYAGVYEVTPGSAGLGNVHAHVVVVWPRWLDYGRVASIWREASKGRSNHLRIDGIGCDPRRAAGYVAKYLSKGSGELPDKLAGEVIAAFYGRRAITTSRRFWLPRCGCRTCGQPVVRVGDVESAAGSAWARVGMPWDQSPLIASTA